MVCRGPDPPEHLSDATKNWWRTVTMDLDMTPHQLNLLLLSCEAWDRCYGALKHDDLRRDRRKACGTE